MDQEKATFGGGCFWCTEAIFKNLKGVSKVTSGYAGGKLPNPTYEQVSRGRTGHAEVIQVDFDPAVIAYEKLLEIYFLTHNPTTMNRQGHDVGEQYRSVIFAHDEGQQQVAEQVRARIESEHVYDQPIVTDIKPAATFYEAEAYHQDYFEKNPDQPYCNAVISPKVAKYRKQFAALWKDAA